MPHRATLSSWARATPETSGAVVRAARNAMLSLRSGAGARRGEHNDLMRAGFPWSLVGRSATVKLRGVFADIPAHIIAGAPRKH